MKISSIQLLLLALLFVGCTTTEPKDFKLTFTMESLKNYKQSIEISSDKTYTIQQEDFFFDTFAKKEQVNTSKGELTNEEFAQLKYLIAHSSIFSMKGSYGFSKKDDYKNPFSGMMYQLNYTEGNKTKTVFISPSKDNTYPGKFPQLLQFISNFISNHLEKK